MISPAHHPRSDGGHNLNLKNEMAKRYHNNRRAHLEASGYSDEFLDTQAWPEDRGMGYSELASYQERFPRPADMTAILLDLSEGGLNARFGRYGALLLHYRATYGPMTD